MSDIPDMQIGHIGLFVENLLKMREFYTDVLGFRVTDEGKGSVAEMAFLSRNPDEHHQIVLATGRPENTFSVVNQISFRVNALSDLRTMRDRVVAAGAKTCVRPITEMRGRFIFSPPKVTGSKSIWPPRGMWCSLMACHWILKNPTKIYSPIAKRTPNQGPATCPPTIGATRHFRERHAPFQDFVDSPTGILSRIDSFQWPLPVRSPSSKSHV
jgi:catechol 2,3-dioxygenase-like lactoylglutathione lyase family enzyme